MRKQAKKRIGLSNVIETSKEEIESQGFLDNARKRPQDFTRKRKMPFPQLVLFMLNLVRSSTQTCLDSFFERIGREDIHMTQQSFSESRDKIKWAVFVNLFKKIVALIYTGFYITWHGYRLSAIDGSKVQLPDDPKLREYFGTVGKGGTAATAQASGLYDVLNNILIDVQMEPVETDERELALRHIEALCSMPSFGKECVLFDRGYASFVLINTMKERAISFVMRVRRKFNLEIDQLAEGDHRVVLRKKGYEDICVRVIKFKLPSGEEETLITDLFDKRMGISAFKELYFMRWPIETKYDELKNKLAVENFSGRTLNAVMQDFFIAMFIANVIAVARWEAQVDVDAAREHKDNKYDYHVNASQAVGAFKDRFILAILEPNPQLRRKKVGRILYLMTVNPAPSRPGRSLPRNPSPRKAKFRHNRKLNC